MTTTGNDRREAPSVAFGGGGTCPEPEMLAAFIDNKLDDVSRERVADHVSRCEDCYTVVRETAVMVQEQPGGTTEMARGQVVEFPVVGVAVPGADGLSVAARADAGGAPISVTSVSAGGGVSQRSLETAPAATSSQPTPPKVVPLPSRRLWPRISALAATLLVFAGGGYFAREQGLFLPPYERAVLPLVKAVGERRFFEPRLTGGFKYGPLISPKRGGPAPPIDPNNPTMRGPVGPAAEDWAILAAAAKIKEAGNDSPAAVSALAAAHLLMGENDEAVRLLERAVDANPSDARLLSDLAAAYLRRGQSGDRGEDYARALESVRRALQMSPELAEARYNEALALSASGHDDEAARAWESVASIEKDAAWRRDATGRRGTRKPLSPNEH